MACPFDILPVSSSLKTQICWEEEWFKKVEYIKSSMEVVSDVKEEAAAWSFTQGRCLEGDNIGFYH